MCHLLSQIRDLSRFKYICGLNLIKLFEYLENITT